MSEGFDPQALLAQLGISTAEEDVAVMPSGGEAFGASTFIAPWSAFLGYTFLTKEDYVLYNQGAEVPLSKPDIRNPRGEWYIHYYRSYDACKSAYDALIGDDQFRPRTVWVFATETASIVGRDIDALREGFGDIIVFDVRVQTMRKGSESYPARNRHQFALISLPSAVAAAATIFKQENAGFDLSEVLDADAPYTDEWFANLFGDLAGGAEDGVYYQRRAALWESLGESNPEAQAIMGSKTASGKPHKLATSSPVLSACLGLAQGSWGKPLWVELTLVKDPLPDAVAKSGNRLVIPAITRIFNSEAEARAAASEENDDSGQPAIPSNWASVPNAAEAFMAELKKHEDKPAPEIVTDVAADSVAQVQAWREYMKAQG